MAGIQMKKQGWQEAIMDGWKLASVTEANGQSEEIKSKFKNDLEFKIYLSDGYWDGQCVRTDPSPKLDVLIIPKPAKLKIFHFEEPIKDIPFGWRLACMSEAAANLDTVKEILQRSKSRYAYLCDGNVNENGIIERKSTATKDYLFIQIAEEAEKGHGSDAVGQRKKGDEKGKGKDKGSGQRKKGDEKGQGKDKGSGQSCNLW